jgi:hypothetical protein
MKGFVSWCGSKRPFTSVAADSRIFRDGPSSAHLAFCKKTKSERAKKDMEPD